jgi:hypothetical protein
MLKIHILFIIQSHFCIENDHVKGHEIGMACSMHREEERTNAYRILVGKPEGNMPLEMLRFRWVDNIKTDLREIE